MAGPYPDDDDRGNDDGPRRPRDRDDDGPRRAGRGREWDGDDRSDSPPKATSVLGVLSLIGGVISLLLSFIPCIGALSLVGGAVGVVLGGIGLLVAGGSNHGKGMPVAGMVVNALSMVVAGLWIFVLANVPKPQPEAEVTAPADAAPPAAITAAQLCREYATNVIKADETYTGKVLEVTGQVKVVTKERVGRVTVELGSRDDTVDCDFGSAARDQLAGIDTGRTVTIRGTCKGIDRQSGFVILENCTLLKLSPADPAPAARAVKVEATKLITEYEADVAAANKAFKGKTVEVSGKVAELMEEDRKELVVVFRGGGAMHLECRLTPEASKEARSTGGVKKGRTVTLRGACSGTQDDDEYVLLENVSVVKK